MMRMREEGSSNNNNMESSRQRQGGRDDEGKGRAVVAALPSFSLDTWLAGWLMNVGGLGWVIAIPVSKTCKLDARAPKVR